MIQNAVKSDVKTGNNNNKNTVASTHLIIFQEIPYGANPNTTGSSWLSCIGSNKHSNYI